MKLNGGIFVVQFAAALQCKLEYSLVSFLCRNGMGQVQLLLQLQKQTI